MLLSVGLVVMSLGVVTVVAGAARARRGGREAPIGFLRVAAIAGGVAVGAAAMHLIARHQSLTIFTMTADTLVVLAPALIGVAVSTDGRARGRFAAGFAAVAATTVAVTSSVLPAHAELIVRCVVMAAVCTACAWLAGRNATLSRSALHLITGATAAYAVYSALRATALLVRGPDAQRRIVVFSEAGATVAVIATVLLVCVAVQMIAAPAVRSARQRSRVLTTVVVGPPLPLGATPGHDRASDLIVELRTAAREVDPLAADVPGGVGVRRPSTIRPLVRALTLVYGWSPNEIESLRTAPDGGTPNPHAFSETAPDDDPSHAGSANARGLGDARV